MWSPAVRHDRRPTMDDYLDHVDHLVKVGGVEHVGFASDLVESPETPAEKWDTTFGPNGTDQNITGILGDWYTYENRTNADFNTLSHVPRIWEAMARRGYSEDARDKIMRGNWLRVVSDVWGG
jgi:membrane dipeptidase